MKMPLSICRTRETGNLEGQGLAGRRTPVPGKDKNAPVHLVIRKAEEKGSERRYTVYDILFFIH